jgi:hypothetical protein
MADYRKIAAHLPEVREYIRLRKWVHRGDTVAYGANIEGKHISTDEVGFRHSVFGGERLSLADCAERERYGVMLGSSNVYGFGLPGNEHTLPSQVGEFVGFPFANVSFPEANTRSMFSVLLNLVVRAKHRPSAVLLLTGGDFTSFCYTGLADPVFGTPDLLSNADAIKERGGKIDVRREFPRLLNYSNLWSGAIIDLCRRASIPLALGEDVTFFERAQPSPRDIECELGVGKGPQQERQFKIHKALVVDYGAARTKQMQASGIPIGGPGNFNDISYVDEFHYDAPGARALAEHFARAMDQAIKEAPKRAPKRKA